MRKWRNGTRAFIFSFASYSYLFYIYLLSIFIDRVQVTILVIM